MNPGLFSASVSYPEAGAAVVTGVQAAARSEFRSCPSCFLGHRFSLVSRISPIESLVAVTGHGTEISNLGRAVAWPKSRRDGTHCKNRLLRLAVDALA